jgi:hypothetical protein
MKKRAFLLSLAVVLLSVLSVVALAANETEMSTTVTYTKAAPPPPALPSATYTIHIPATVAMSNQIFAVTEFSITASNLNLNPGQSVIVTVDDKTYGAYGGDGMLHLTNNSNDNVIRVIMNIWDYALGGRTGIIDGIVARFDNNGSTLEYGPFALTALSVDVAAAPPGTYTGTIYFKIGIVND